MKPSTFCWEGTNQEGRTVKGEQIAINAKILRAQLRQRGITLQAVRKKTKSLFRSPKIRGAEITVFTRQIATLLTAGIPLIQSFNLIGREHSNPAMRLLVETLRSSIEQGNSIGNALSKYPRYFNELYCTLVTAGEYSGNLDVLLDRIATYKEKTDFLIRKIKKAFYYPLAIIFVAALVSLVLLIFVIPQFQKLYTGFGAALPTPTQWVINLSQLLQSSWWFIILTISALSAGFTFAYRHSAHFIVAIDGSLLKLPVFGVLFAKSAIARFARTLSTTFASGIPLINALQTASGATGNRIYTRAILNIQENVTTGQPLHLAIRQTKLFPSLVIQMIAVGEESGTLEKMLNKVADIFEKDVDQVIDSLGSLLEPFIMMILGVLIGGFVITMYLPIFKLGNVL